MVKIHEKSALVAIKMKTRQKKSKKQRTISENIEKILCFTAPDAIPQSEKSAPSEAPKCRNQCILQVQMRFSAARKCARKDADCVFYRVLRYKMRSQKIGIAESRPKTKMCQNPRPSMKVTCRMSKGRNEAAKTGKIAETFG